ncbi:MAG: DUF6569 family protein [Actinomycetes bacterium]
MADRHEVIDGAQLVQALRLGERQAEGPLAVFPLFASGDDGPGDGGESAETAGGGEHAASRRRPPRYITLRQALAEGRAQITEVSEGGSVPELRVVNKGDARILVLDGEELRGAKQNRSLNTTILIDRYSTLVAPVSCTERGRWAYASRQFAESEMLAERQVRFAMRSSVHAAMCAGVGARADQGRVWSEVDGLHRRQGTHSGTGAMRDSYEARKGDLDRVLAAFPPLDGQTGVLVLHGSRVVGLDLVSRAPQYAELHDKLLRSYAFEALVRGGEPGERPVAEAFLERIAALAGRRFKSPGLGWDVRFEGGGVLGSALVYRGYAVHAAFFDVGGAGGSADEPAPDSQPSWRIADARERARRRQTR